MKTSCRLTVIVMLVLLQQLCLSQTTIKFQTGTVPIGTQDPNIWVRGNWATGPTDPRPGLVGANFALSHPFVVNPLSWSAPFAGGNYVAPVYQSGWGYGNPLGWEYFVDFNLPVNLASLNLNFQWHGDDLAYPNFNGTYFGVGNGAESTFPAQNFDLLSLSHSGSNRLSLFVENANIGFNPTGVDFKASFTYTQRASVPEYGSGATGALATLVGLWLVCVKRGRKSSR